MSDIVDIYDLTPSEAKKWKEAKESVSKANTDLFSLEQELKLTHAKYALHQVGRVVVVEHGHVIVKQVPR